MCPDADVSLPFWRAKGLSCRVSTGLAWASFRLETIVRYKYKMMEGPVYRGRVKRLGEG